MMTAQESKDWSEFSQKVIDLMEDSPFDKSCNIPVSEWSLYDCLSALRGCVGRAIDENNPAEFKQYELIKVAYFAQQAYTRLKNPSFDRKTAMQHLKAGKAVRPADDTEVIALSYLYGPDLTRYVGVNCSAGKLTIPEQLVVATEEMGVFFMDRLPSTAKDWVLATQEEIDAVKNWGKSEDMDDSDE